MLVQALDTKPAVERFDHCVIRGLSWPAEVELYAVELRSWIQAPRDELWSVVDSNRLWLAALPSHPLQDAHDIVSSQSLTNLDGQALTAMLIHERQQPESLPADVAFAA
jgi:hypothetical protein